jgi:hypothetical protein
MRFLEVNIDGCKDLQHEVEGNDDSMKTWTSSLHENEPHTTATLQHKVHDGFDPKSSAVMLDWKGPAMLDGRDCNISW